MSINLVNSAWNHAQYNGVKFLGLVGLVESQFQLLPKDEWAATVEANLWINDGGMAPTLVIYTVGTAAAFAYGAAIGIIRDTAHLILRT